MVWLANEFDMTKLGCPVALPRFISRPSESTITLCPSGNAHSCTCGFTSVFTMPGTCGQAGHVDLGVEVADVGHDGVVLHPGQVQRP